MALIDDLNRELLGVREIALPSAPILCSLQDSGNIGCCTLCGKRAADWPKVPAGWEFTPAFAEAEVPAFLICSECLFE